MIHGLIFRTIFVLGLALLLRAPLAAQAPQPDGEDFQSYAEKLRQKNLQSIEPPAPASATPRTFRQYPWKTKIVTSVFWIGNSVAAKRGSKTPGNAWDPAWQKSYGGFDNPIPAKRREFRPVAFVPKLNSFYVALPYNDVADGVTKPQAVAVVPWFRDAFAEDGQSVCRDRWVLIRNTAGKICWAQWSDCRPFGSDDWQYVFGNERPKSTDRHGTGLYVSPAVRDYLGLKSTDVTDWKFAEFKDVPAGPWATYGENNQFVLQARRLEQEQTQQTAGSAQTPNDLPPVAEGPPAKPAKPTKSRR